MSIQESTVSRRGFLTSAAAVAGAAMVAGMAGCAPNQNSSTMADTGEAERETYEPTETMSCDVAVVGLGASGMMAAIAAADNGAGSVIAMDAAPSFGGSTNCATTGAWIIESDASLAAEPHMTQQEAYDYLVSGDNLMFNPGLLRNMIRHSGKAGNVLDELAPGTLVHTWELGIPYEALDTTLKSGYMYNTRGDDRGAAFDALIASRTAIQPLWSCRALQILTDESGAVTGLICDNNGTITQIDAAKVIVCGGGFISNPEMIEQYYHTTSLVSCGYPTVDGSGIKMVQEAGGNITKNFGCAFNEMGGCSNKASAIYAWVPDGTHNTSSCFYTTMFGCLTVNKQGRRFVSEEKMSGDLMFCGEPSLRQGSYYVIMDQKMVDTITTTPIFDIMSADAKASLVLSLAMAFDGYVCTDFLKDFDVAVEEKWGYKGDTLAEVADYFGLTNLEETVATYNGYAEAGADEDFFVAADQLKPVREGPFYAIELQPGSWCTTGGIQVDDCCRALNIDCEPIANLFMAGLDADILGSPYYLGATANGMAYASGYLAGETAATELS